jgi:hypothetical protein
MSQPKVCDFFKTPAGCRRGANCKWRHERASTPSSPSSPSSAGAPTRSGSSNVPNGVCRFFWNSGNCRFTDCRFRHVREGDSASSTPPAPPSATRFQSPSVSTATSQTTRITPPLKAGGARYQLHNIFLLPNYKFANPAPVNRFVNLLASCSEDNEWVRAFY